VEATSLLLPAATFLLLLGVKDVAENERLLVFRLNRYLGVRGPGTVYVLPFVDKVARINLDERVPHWRAVTAAELQQELDRLGKTVEQN
jgi:regulator of protease activity HflC (stomatin/prohibitin superfamily)